MNRPGGFAADFLQVRQAARLIVHRYSRLPRHSRADGNPEVCCLLGCRVPACAGMTIIQRVTMRTNLSWHSIRLMLTGYYKFVVTARAIWH